MNKQEMKRERRTEMLKAKDDKAERQLSPGLCPEFSAEVPGQNPPLEGLDSGGKGIQSTPKTPYPAKPESYRQESWAWLWVPKGQSTP